MWNAMKTKSLVSAVLITATIQGSLLWGLNNVATAGTSGVSQTSVSSLPATPTASRPATSYVTLEPVVIVGRRDTVVAENTTVGNSVVALATQDRCTNATAKPVALNGQKNSRLGFC